LDAFTQEGSIGRPDTIEYARSVFSGGVNQQTVVVGGDPDAPGSVGRYIFDQQAV
jgi:hypothetical protein